MRTLSEILKAVGIEIDDAAIQRLQTEMAQDYRSLAEVERKDQQIEQKDARISELEGQVSAMGQKVNELEQSGGENGAKVAELQKQVAEFERKEADRQQAEEDAKKRMEFESVFSDALGGQEFANDLIRESVFDKAYRMHAENPAMKIEDILQGITGDMAGVWKNPQRDPAKMPTTTKPGTEGGKMAINSLDDLRGMSAETINANWDSIKPLLEQGR